MTFSPEQIYCVLDYETYSEADLKKVGAFEYSKHDSTDVLCVAWAVGTKDDLALGICDIHTWAPLSDGVELRGKLVELCNVLSRKDIIKVAHNSFFEQVITANVFKRRYATGLPPLPPEQWVCTASLAQAVALPRALANVTDAINLAHKKNMQGHRLMLKMCKPKKPTKTNPFQTRHTDLKDLQAVIDYCVDDVKAEIQLFLKLPPLIPIERETWILDQKINLRGFMVDRDLVKTILKMVEDETARLNEATFEGTDGKITSANQRDAILSWLNDEGVFLPDLRKDTVAAALASGKLPEVAHTVLELRRAAAKTSTSKFVALEAGSRFDGCLRDTLEYHGAGTGRWSGKKFQPQNLPRGTIKNTDQACEILSQGDIGLVRLIYDEPMAAFSSCIRGMIIPRPGMVLDVGDYASIEARGIAWIAGDEPALEAFRKGIDAYKKLASKIFNVPISEVTPAQRFVGKQAELGCGYQMGPEKFKGTCAGYGEHISDELAESAVRAWRESHPAIVDFWRDLKDAAMAAIRNKNNSYRVGKTLWYCKGSFLWCVLPSGRKLAYPFPSVKWVPAPWDKTQTIEAIHYFTVDSLTKKWKETTTHGGKLAENVVQALARDCLRDAMLRINATKIWNIMFTAHDEIVSERPANKGSLDQFIELMSVTSDWAKGLPLAVEGWSGMRYKK
jgi:DNA polymerase